MPYDSCGATKLEGKELIARLAEALGVDRLELEASLRCLTRSYKKGIEQHPELVEFADATLVQKLAGQFKKE